MNANLLKSGIPPALAILAIAGTAAAAVTLAYTSTSTVGLGVKPAPVAFSAGPDAAPSDYVPAFSLSANRTTFSTTLRGVPEAVVTVDDLLRVRNEDTRPHTVTLSAPPATSTFVSTYRVDFFDGAELVGTLDLKNASPSVTFADLAAGKTLAAKVTLALAPGAGANNVGGPLSVAIAVSA